MRKIIRFPIERTMPRRAHAWRGAGEIILFPGVRYEYLGDAEEHTRPRVSRHGHHR